METMITLVKWFMFSVLIALIPLLFNSFFQFTETQNVSMSSAVKHGELALITVLMCATAIGDLLASKGESKSIKLIFSGLALLVLVFSALFFGWVSATNPIVQKPSASIRDVSIVLYLFGLTVSSVCVWLSVEKNNGVN